MSNIKQIIIVRKDLKMRRGKEIAQACHVSMMFLTSRFCKNPNSYYERSLLLSDSEIEWLDGTATEEGKYTKVCLQVNSEEELYEIYNKAKGAGLTAHMVIDSGKTEFHGIPTPTAVAIGPNGSEDIDKITGHLKLM